MKARTNTNAPPKGGAIFGGTHVAFWRWSFHQASETRVSAVQPSLRMEILLNHLSVDEYRALPPRVGRKTVNAAAQAGFIDPEDASSRPRCLLTPLGLAHRRAYPRKSQAYHRSAGDKALTPNQCRAARALVGLSQHDLALQAGVSVALLRTFEAGGGAPDGSTMAIQNALEGAGAILIASGSTSPAGGEGARLASPPERSVDTIVNEVVQYPEFMENDAPPGAGG